MKNLRYLIAFLLAIAAACASGQVTPITPTTDKTLIPLAATNFTLSSAPQRVSVAAGTIAFSVKNTGTSTVYVSTDSSGNPSTALEAVAGGQTDTGVYSTGPYWIWGSGPGSATFTPYVKANTTSTAAGPLTDFLTGTLTATAASPYTTTTSPQAVTLIPGAVAVSVANTGSGTVYVSTTTSSTGLVLTAIAGATEARYFTGSTLYIWGSVAGSASVTTYTKVVPALPLVGDVAIPRIVAHNTGCNVNPPPTGGGLLTTSSYTRQIQRSLWTAKGAIGTAQFTWCNWLEKDDGSTGLQTPGNVVTINAACIEPFDTQTVTMTGTPTGGTITYSYGTVGTFTVNYNSTAAQFQTAIQALVGAGQATCTGGPFPGSTITCTVYTTPTGPPVVPFAINANNLTGGSSPTCTFGTFIGSSFIPINFAGSGTVTLQDGGRSRSDNTYLGLPAGSSFWIRTDLQVASAGNKWVQNHQSIFARSDGLGEGLITSGFTGVTQTIANAAGRFFDPISVTGTQPFGGGFSIGVIGDSIAQNVGDGGPTSGSVGWPQRIAAGSFLGTSAQIGLINLSQASTWLHSFVNPSLDGKDWSFLPDAKVWLICRGRNDATNAQSAAQMEADATKLANLVMAAGRIPVFCTITPKPASTNANGYTPGTTQTPSNNEAIRIAYNDWLRTQTVASVIDISSLVETSTDSGIWNNFGPVLASGTLNGGTVSGGSNVTATDSTASWTTNQWSSPGDGLGNLVMVITGGTGAGRAFWINSNTATTCQLYTLTNDAGTISLDNTSTYAIVDLPTNDGTHPCPRMHQRIANFVFQQLILLGLNGMLVAPEPDVIWLHEPARKVA